MKAARATMCAPLIMVLVGMAGIDSPAAQGFRRPASPPISNMAGIPSAGLPFD